MTEAIYQEIQIENLATYISNINQINDNNKSTEFYFRGQSNSAFKNTLPYLFRNEELFNNEDKLFKEFLRNDPELFKDTINNFDRLSLMQHHQMATRLLDLTTNPLVALYFAVSENNGNDAEIFIFSNKLNRANLVLDSNIDPNSNLIEFFKTSDTMDSRWVKDVFSDEIQVESSIVRLSKATKQLLINQGFYAFFDSFEKKNGSKDWSSIYAKILEDKESNEEYTGFNTSLETEMSYHEINVAVKLN